MRDADVGECVHGCLEHAELGERRGVQDGALRTWSRVTSGAARRQEDGGPLGRGTRRSEPIGLSGDRASVLLRATLPARYAADRERAPRPDGRRGLPAGRGRPARRAGVRRADRLRAPRRRLVPGADPRRQGRPGRDGGRGVQPLRAAARPAGRARRRARGGHGAVHRGAGGVPRAHRSGQLARGPGQGLRRRRDRGRLLPRGVGVPRRLDPRPGAGGARRHRALRVRGRSGPGRDRGRPAAGRPAGAVGPAAGRRGAEPGAAGGGRAGRAGDAAGGRHPERGADLAEVGRMLARLTENHTKRMASLGLSA